jgi:hypothetical protein
MYHSIIAEAKANLARIINCDHKVYFINVTIIFLSCEMI